MTYVPQIGDVVSSTNGKPATVSFGQSGSVILTDVEPVNRQAFGEWRARCVLAFDTFSAIANDPDYGYRVVRGEETIVRDPMRDYSDEEWLAWFEDYCARTDAKRASLSGRQA